MDVIKIITKKGKNYYIIITILYIFEIVQMRVNILKKTKTGNTKKISLIHRNYYFNFYLNTAHAHSLH